MAGKKTQGQSGEWTVEGETTLEMHVDLFVPQHARPRTILRQVTGPGAPRDLMLMGPAIIIGRSRTADVCIDSPELSRQHIKLEFDGDEYTCTDLGSQNGLYLNGLEIHSCVLRGGDTIQIGNVTFVYREDGG
jgi:pSer/pThr/pTyr-binding forkhead associated (FHA) protein